MSHKSLPRLGAGTAAAFACLMLAAPLAAQEAGATTGSQPAAEAPPAPAIQPAPQPGTQTGAPAGGTGEAAGTAPAATAPAAVPSTTASPSAPTPTSAPASAPTPADTPAAAVLATPAPAAPAASTAAPAAQGGEAATVPAAEASTTAPAATAATPGTEPAPALIVETAPQPEPQPEPIGAGILPQAVQDVLAPVLTQVERDPGLPHDLSPIGMFMAADWVVKSVMIGLAFASVVTWTVFVAKLLELAGAGRRAQSGIRRIEAAPSLPAALAAAGSRRDPVSRMIRAAATEYDRSAPVLEQAGDSGVKERVESHLDRIEANAGRRMTRGTGVLATIGSTAPFVGLFGTVWGIMNSFIGISEAQTTNLAVVAPGIAEALLATAIGLVAAIPAVVIYNVFARAITGYRLRLSNAAAGVRRLVSRDLDFRGATPNLEV